MKKDKQPVVFVHGLWLHTSSWTPWVDLFNEAGYNAMALDWPGDSSTVADARANPKRSAGYGINEITDHIARSMGGLQTPPVVIGHSFGGLIVQKLLAQGRASAAIAIDPAFIKGVKKLPAVALLNAAPVLSNPAQYNGSNSLSRKQFRKAFANALSEEESDELYDAWTIPSPGRPLFQNAIANVLPHSAAAVDITADRGPLLLIGGTQDQTVPAVTTIETHKLYAKADTVNDYKEFDRGHSLVIDSGWRELADYTLSWLKKQTL